MNSIPKAASGQVTIEKLEYSKLIETDQGVRILAVDRACGAGLFSNFTTLLWDLIECRKHGLLVNSLSAGNGVEFYKDTLADDPINLLLNPIKPKFTFFDLPIISKPLHHSRYGELNFDELKPYIQTYFKPSSLVMKRALSLICKYNIILSNTSCVCFRGNDKSIEAPRIDPSIFLQEILKNIDQNPSNRVLVQTDELLAREFLLGGIGHLAFFFTEMPVTNSTGLAIHLHSYTNRLDFAVLLLAVNFLIAKSYYIVTHTGNMALWQFLYRGHSRNAYQL